MNLKNYIDDILSTEIPMFEEKNNASVTPTEMDFHFNMAVGNYPETRFYLTIYNNNGDVIADAELAPESHADYGTYKIDDMEVDIGFDVAYDYEIENGSIDKKDLGVYYLSEKDFEDTYNKTKSYCEKIADELCNIINNAVDEAYVAAEEEEYDE